MIIGLYILAIFLFVMATRAYDGLPWGIGGFLLSGPLILVTLVNIENHSRNLAMMRKGDFYISNQQERLDDLERRLSSINRFPSGNFIESANASLVENISKATIELNEVKSAKSKAALEIERTKIGPFWFIVSIYGEK